MPEAGAQVYEPAILRGTVAMHGGYIRAYRACHSWFQFDRRAGPYVPPASATGLTRGGEPMHHFREHYYHDDFARQMLLNPGAAVPVLRGCNFGADCDCHLRSMHPPDVVERMVEARLVHPLGRRCPLGKVQAAEEA